MDIILSCFCTFWRFIKHNIRAKIHITIWVQSVVFNSMLEVFRGVDRIISLYIAGIYVFIQAIDLHFHCNSMLNSSFLGKSSQKQFFHVEKCAFAFPYEKWNNLTTLTVFITSNFECRTELALPNQFSNKLLHRIAIRAWTKNVETDICVSMSVNFFLACIFANGALIKTICLRIHTHMVNE